MFTRSSSADPKPLARGLGNGAAARGIPPSPRPSAAKANATPVIGDHVKITGQAQGIFSRGTLQVGGKIERGSGGAEVIIGKTDNTASGTAAVEGRIVRGTVIHHASLAIVQGADFDGRRHRAADASRLTADLRS